jgi:hypothetical protein
MPRDGKQSSKRKPRRRPTNRVDVRRAEFAAVIETLKHVNVTRAEFIAATKAINESVHKLEIQFRRIADIQAELDAVKREVAKLIAP